MVYMLTVLVLVLTAVSCAAIPREDMLDFGAVQTGGPGGGWNLLHQPVHFFGRSVGLSQVTVDGAVRLYTLDWDGPFQYAGEVLASMPQSQQEDYTAYFQQVNSNNSRTLAKLAAIVRNSAAGHTYKEFVPAYAAVWSWTRNSTNTETFQVILVAQGGTTFLINSYCSDNEQSSRVSPRFAVTDGESPVVVFRERKNTAGVVQPLLIQAQEEAAGDRQYVLRFDSLRCFNQDQFYCLTDQPKNFTTANVTSRSAALSFMETFDLGLTTCKSPDIDYNISCVDEYGSTVLTACLNDTQETKVVPMYNLLPFTEYSCRLVKIVSQDTPTTTVVDPVKLRFRTEEDVPEVPPSEVTVTVNSTSVKVTWSPLLQKFRSGVITYNLSVMSEYSEFHTARVRGHSYQFLNLRPGTRYIVTIRASTGAGEGPASSEQQFVTATVRSSETPPEPTTTPASSTTASTVEQHIVTESVATTKPTSATDGTTPSAPAVTHESTTMEDPTTAVDNHNGIDDLRVATDTDEPFAMSIAAIAAIALGATFLITILVLIVACVCFCVYNYNRKRKTYIVNRSISNLPSANVADTPVV